MTRLIVQSILKHLHLQLKIGRLFIQRYKKEVPEKEKFDSKYLEKGKINKLFKNEAYKGMKKAFTERVDIMRNQRGSIFFPKLLTIFSCGHIMQMGIEDFA